MAVTRYSPNEVKLAVAGDGAAAKVQVQGMTRRLLRLSEAPHPDAADTLALAVCHLWRTPLREGVARAVAAESARR